jgi:hypothetical protein
MALDVELVFESPDEHVQEAGTQIFKLFTRNDEYPLPDVVLRSAAGAQRVNVRQVSVISVGPSAGQFGPLATHVRDVWTGTAGGGWVTGRRQVAMGTAIPGSLVGPALGESAGQAAELVVVWRYVYIDASTAESAHNVRVRLQFQPRDARAPGGVSGGDAEAALLPDPLRGRGSSQFNGFAAIDFGTSSSAVAVYDSRRTTPRSIDTGQAAVLRRELAKLLRSSPDGALATLWRTELGALLENVAVKLPQYAFTDIEGLAAELTEQAAAERAELEADEVLDAVCLTFEQHVAECRSPELADWLGPRLLACFDRAFLTPALDEQQIREVVFDPTRNEREISSAFKFTERHPIAIALGSDKDADEISLRLKAEMFDGALIPDATVPGDKGDKEATVDDLVARVYLELVTRSEKFLRSSEGAEQRPLVHIVVTYPTLTMPSDRQRLGRMLERSLGMDRVVTDFDEGVAAGLFFLMRDFSTRRLEFGVDGLRARARQVGLIPLTWQQNMLIIDIGAGTTDIAFIGLTVQDITPDGGDPLLGGRHYVIKPEVLNSTGHRQLGGNYLTLRVFYWLKATILDALATGPSSTAGRAELKDRIADALGPEAVGRLADLVAGGGADEPVPEEVAEVLRENLPTHNENQHGPGQPADEFWLLWRIAEEAKIALGVEAALDNALSSEDATFTIDHARLQPVLNAIDARDAPGQLKLAGLLAKEPLVLGAAGFKSLIRPVLKLAAELGSWLVRTTFEPDPGAPPDAAKLRLDRVVLSGKTSKMPLLKQVVSDVLAAGGESGGRRLPWNPASLQVEFERAKQAAALGACWAQVFREYELGADEAELAKGRTLVTFDVENLFRSLPCGFYQLLGQKMFKRLLRAGTRMVEGDDTGRLVARADWERLVPMFEVHRPNGPGETIQWGVFKYYSHRDLDGFRPSPAIWGPGAGHQGSRIKAQLEIDHGLAPHLYLCQGDPHYFVGGLPGLTVELRDAFGANYWETREYRLRRLPAAVMVRGRDDAEKELFPAWLPEESDDVAGYFPVFCHVLPDVPGKAVRGRISDPLPAPSTDGYYDFSLRFPDGTRKDVAKLIVSGPRGDTARYRATLDIQGTVRLHRGEPPYWAAQSLRDVEEYAGSVRRVQMDPGEDELKASRKPFDGRH